MKKFNIKIKSHDRTISAFEQESLAQALVRQGILIRSDCGGKGTCQKCRVTTGTKSRLACKTKVKHDLAVDIPPGSLTSPDIISKPPIKLPTKYMAGDTSLQSEQEYAVAVDLGTTTIAVYLVGVSSKILLSSLSVKNPQSFFGDDVMTRITRTMEDETALSKMQAMAVKAVEWGINSIVTSCGIRDNRVKTILVAGNPTMIHILLKEDPRSMGVYPYNPVFTRQQALTTGSLGFSFGHEKQLITLPLLSGFIGSDIVSAAMAVDLENQASGTLLVDIGTNGEIMLKGKDHILAASCATGPAFEGACISCGMPAVPGAVRRVCISQDTLIPEIKVIPNQANRSQKPSGICGSGMISAVTALLKTGIIRPDGRFDLNSGSPNLVKKTPASFIIASAMETENRVDIEITQKDIRAVQLAKGALSAGIKLLCRKAGLKKPGKVLVAGAFGSFIDPDDMLATGILPRISPEKIHIIGNAAGCGAVLTLFNSDGIESAGQLIKNIIPVDLGTDPGFQDTFVEHLNFSTH